MKNLIYYPNFESNDIEWLKFALIYLDNFSPIVPIAGDRFLSELYHKLLNETDLLKIHRPNYREGDRATRKAIEYATKVLENPYAYSDELHTINPKREWETPDNQIYTLFEDKFVGDWRWFCRDNRLAKNSNLGVQISKSLGELYMTFLVQEIAYENEASPITDKKELDDLSIALRTKNVSEDNKIEVAKNIIKHQLPLDFRNLHIDKVIQLRNKAGFKEKQIAFQSELSGMYEKVGSAIDPKLFIESYKKNMKEWTLELSQYGIGVAAAGISTYILIKNDLATDGEYIKQILEGGIALIGGIEFVKKINANTDRKYCRQYLTELKKI